MEWQRRHASRFLRADEKRGGRTAREYLLQYLSSEKTGSRWRATAAMPLKGRCDAVHYGGRKKDFQRRINEKLM